MAGSKLVKLHNPHLMAVNPFGKPKRSRKNASKAKNAASRAKTLNKKKHNPSRVARNPFDFAGILKKGTFAGVGALGTTFIVNMLPMPTNPILNAIAKGGVGVGLGYLVKSFGPVKDMGDFVMAGGVGLAAADGIRFLIPKLRTVIVPTPEQATTVKQLAPTGELNDVVYADLGDVVTSMNFDSSWANH